MSVQHLAQHRQTTSVDRRLRAVSENADGASPRPVQSVACQEQVLGEIVHELGNFFHKLYYWAEYFRERDSRNGRDAPAGEMLEGTIKGLHDFLKVAFEYFSPLQVSLARMSTDDVLSSFIGKLSTKLCSSPVETTRSASWPRAEVLVDPGRIAQALEIAVRHVAHQVGDRSRIEVAAGDATHQGRPGIEIRVVVDSPAGPSAFFKTPTAGVEWALAEKLFDLHGGALSRCSGQSNEQGFVMFLPVGGCAGQ